jgi:hypothetical protein
LTVKKADITTQARENRKSQRHFFHITTAFKPQQSCDASENRLMKNDLKIVSTFLILNASIISAVVLLSTREGIRFDKIIAHLFS